MAEDEFDAAIGQYKDRILRDTATHLKTNGRFELQVTSGRHFVRQDMTDQEDGDSYSKYDYVGSLLPLNQYVVLHVMYEDYQYLLVDRQTGDTLTLASEPLLSPENNLLAALSFDPYQSEEPYAVYTELYRVAAAGKIQKTQRISLDVVLPEYCNSSAYCWENKNTIAIKAELNGGKAIYKRLQLFQ